MRLRKPTTIWLPSTKQIMMAPEQAILAALDANLELAIRVLQAEHVTLDPDDHLPIDPHDQSFTFELLLIAKALVRGADCLRRLVADYRCVADDLLTNNTDEKSDDDFPF